MVLAGAPDPGLIRFCRRTSYQTPVLFSDVRIDFNRAGVQPIAASPLATGYPILFARLGVEIVRLAAVSAKPVETAAVVVQSKPGFRE